MTINNVGVVVIGRNEGARLIRALRSIKSETSLIVYVDSGSTDGSQAAAVAAGAILVELDTTAPFTAARARNAGFEIFLSRSFRPEYVQFLDGDCELQPGWIATGETFLSDNEDVALVCGRRRERFPDATVYNFLIDQEWDTPLGEAKACGGDAMMRSEALQAVGGFNPNLIAGEEPELCVRIRAEGWKIWRLDEEMTLHDAALKKFSQWWRRNRRAGHAYAEGAVLHGAPPEYLGVRGTLSALFWAVCLPLVAVLGTVASPWSLALLLAWPMQVLRLAMQGMGLKRAFFLMIGKLPEAQGIINFWLARLHRKNTKLIEYK